MATEARNRAQRCRDHAEECLQLAATTTDATARKHYEMLAEEYQRVAIAEETLADKIEAGGATFSAQTPK